MGRLVGGADLRNAHSALLLALITITGVDLHSHSLAVRLLAGARNAPGILEAGG